MNGKGTVHCQQMRGLAWLLCPMVLITGCQSTPEIKKAEIVTAEQSRSLEPPQPSSPVVKASQERPVSVAASQGAHPAATQAALPPPFVPEASKVVASLPPPPSAPELGKIAAGPPPPSSKLISVHLEDADLTVVLRVLGEAAGINFLVGQGVKSQVTMKVDKLPVSEAWAILQAILNANNLMAVKEGSIYKILPGPQAQKQPGSITFGRDVGEGDGFLTQIVPLQHLTAGGMVKIFEPLMNQGRVVAHQETNTLIVSGPVSVIKEVVQMVKTLDVPGRKIDVPQVFVYYVANAKAGELAGVLQTVFTRKGQTGSSAAPLFASLERGGAVPVPPTPGVGPGKPDEGVSFVMPNEGDEKRIVGEVRIVPDERTNALIIKATAHDYEVVKETIQKLDLVPKQVIIEILVAEVTLSDNFNLGVEWFIKTGMFAFSNSVGLGAASGFTALFVDSNDVRAFLTTLATLTNVQIVTSPHLLARDNKAARIQIGQEVPIVTGSQSTLTGAALGGQNVFQTIQQRDIGRILNITPHVTEKRQVTLDINLEISDTLPSSTVRGTPSFSKRSINSSVVVEDRQSLMLGGIIDSATNRTVTGFPWLKDIPYIGFLFGSVSDTTTRSELVILLTPHVIGSPEDGISETKRFKDRLEMLQEKIQGGLKP